MGCHQSKELGRPCARTSCAKAGSCDLEAVSKLTISSPRPPSRSCWSPTSSSKAQQTSDPASLLPNATCECADPCDCVDAVPDCLETPEEVEKWPLICAMRDSVIGAHQLMYTPFGVRLLVYADYTASGRCLTFLEDFLQSQILPFYANTHTETSCTGKQTTKFREEAREIIAKCTNCGPEDHVIFVGNGVTSAIHLVVHLLGLRIPERVLNRTPVDTLVAPDERPVVFIGPYEHHSNEVMWRECAVDVVTIAECPDGQIDLANLEAQLKLYQNRPLLIGSFCAASNVTGIQTHVEAVTALLHLYGALSFWDYATAAPYLDIDMNPKVVDHPLDDISSIPCEVYKDSLLGKDAVFISPHKFVGGPGASGVLIIKGSVAKNRVPVVPGGGTVHFVTSKKHLYLSSVEHREEGGTPNIVGCIRAGLTFQLKEAIGCKVIEKLEHRFSQRVIERWSANSKIQLLGSTTAHRLAIFSFNIVSHGRYLHHDFVVSLLEHIFGIQARGGCSCAGPYGQHLLGMKPGDIDKIVDSLRLGFKVLKPGWVRVNFNYFMSEDEFLFILDAVEMIAEHGWKLLPLYKADFRTGMWSHCGSKCPILGRKEKDQVLSLHDIDFQTGMPSYPRREHMVTKASEHREWFKRTLDQAREIFTCAAKALKSTPHEAFGNPTESNSNIEKNRWFLTKEDVLQDPMLWADEEVHVEELMPETSVPEEQCEDVPEAVTISSIFAHNEMPMSFKDADSGFFMCPLHRDLLPT